MTGRRSSTLALAALLVAVGCGRQPAPELDRPAANVPVPDVAEMEPQVEKRLAEVRGAVLADPGSAEAWGRFGMVAHAHELWEEAAAAYEEARTLDPDDPRWPFYLGDVLSVLGTDLEVAVAAFERVKVLEPDYAPTHLRLGNVLVALSRQPEATAEFERALELSPELQPARVALAQARLAAGALDSAEQLLREVLEVAPRHGQALSTLAQVLARLGRRDEAREVAERSRDAAAYNLYSDPLMSQVVAEGVSSVALWERAKSFLENGNWEQASLGLRQVVALQPDNADVHQQLAIAYGNLGNGEGARRHLRRAVALAPDAALPRLQLAAAELELGGAAAAIEQLERVLELEPDNVEAQWMLARALLARGDVAASLTHFEQLEARAVEVPAWAHVYWGRALAEAGRTDEALARFEEALAVDRSDPQALFFTGLLLEGLGRIEEASDYYCRSLAAQPNPPASGRLQALGRSCPRAGRGRS